MSTTQENALELRNVTKRFGDKLAVNGVSFSVAPGAFLGLLGRNGAGKSTLFESVVGATTPKSGRLVSACGVLDTRRAWRA